MFIKKHKLVPAFANFIMKCDNISFPDTLDGRLPLQRKKIKIKIDVHKKYYNIIRLYLNSTMFNSVNRYE